MWNSPRLSAVLTTNSPWLTMKLTTVRRKTHHGRVRNSPRPAPDRGKLTTAAHRPVGRPIPLRPPHPAWTGSPSGRGGVPATAVQPLRNDPRSDPAGDCAARLRTAHGRHCAARRSHNQKPHCALRKRRRRTAQRSHDGPAGGPSVASPGSAPPPSPPAQWAQLASSVSADHPDRRRADGAQTGPAATFRHGRGRQRESPAWGSQIVRVGPYGYLGGMAAVRSQEPLGVGACF
jgi:hypothetical protein